MIIDFATASLDDVEADICIVGGGAAGLAIAHALLGTQLQICLLESGGFGAEHRTQALYEGVSLGSPRLDPAISRLRAFGGSCNLWGGGLFPLDALDFAGRDWVPGSGWPIDRTEIAAFHARAKAFCRIADHRFPCDEDAPASTSILRFERDEEVIDCDIAMNPIAFGDIYRDDFERAQNLRVLLHANLVELEASESANAVRRARIASLDGAKASVRARCFVLACGGIENARQLLASSAIATNGLGNDHDLVGRYFQDHPGGFLGSLLVNDADRLRINYVRSTEPASQPAYPEICFTDHVQRRDRVLDARARFVAVESQTPRGIAAMRRLKHVRRQRTADENTRVAETIFDALKLTPPTSAPALDGGIAINALRVGRGIGDIARAYARRRRGLPAVAASHVDLIGFFEQAPNRDSRITLADERDALGQRKVAVDWRLTPLDHHTYRVAARVFGGALAKKLGGAFRIAPWLDGEGEPSVVGRAHHIGTTRMADSPQRGVVDTDCRVHGVDNLYVAGSSVFPTGGWAFPTFTIVALAIRLADHIAQRFAA